MQIEKSHDTRHLIQPLSSPVAITLAVAVTKSHNHNEGTLRIIATITITIITTTNNPNSISHLQLLQGWQHGLAAAKSGEPRATYQHPAYNK
jgi:hypothetical protein